MDERRELPSSIELEKRILAAMTLGNDSISDITSVLNEEDFFRQDHRLIFRAILSLYSQTDNAVGVNDVVDEIKKRGDDKFVSASYIISTLHSDFTTERVNSYVKTVKEKSNMRRLIYLGENLVECGYDPRKTFAETMEMAEKELLSISSNTNRVGFESAAVISQRAFERMQHLHNHPEELQGVTTGFIDLDKITNGLQKSDLILLAARPSMGKTALALNMAANSAAKNNVVALFSLEMSKGQLGYRLISTASGVNSMYLNTGNFSDNDMVAMVDSLDYMTKLNLFIDDTPGITIMDIRSMSRRLKREKGLNLIVIDYLQLMQGSRSRYSEQNRQQEISEISRNLKALARELDVPILALSQLSRSVEMRAEKKPQLSDLRESGSLEQDADIVMFLYRDEYYNRDNTDNENIAELIIAKNRNGPTTSIRLHFQKEILRFGDLTRVEM